MPVSVEEAARVGLTGPVRTAVQAARMRSQVSNSVEVEVVLTVVLLARVPALVHPVVTVETILLDQVQGPVRPPPPTPLLGPWAVEVVVDRTTVVGVIRLAGMVELANS